MKSKNGAILLFVTLGAMLGYLAASLNFGVNHPAAAVDSVGGGLTVAANTQTAMSKQPSSDKEWRWFMNVSCLTVPESIPLRAVPGRAES